MRRFYSFTITMYSAVRRYLLPSSPGFNVLSTQIYLVRSDICQKSKRMIHAENKVIKKKILKTALTQSVISDTRHYSETTVDEEEIKRFSALADLWWDESGEFEALHTMNELRVPLVRDGLLQQHALQRDKPANHIHPLKSFKILDVGCGGGILTEPLARLGAEMTGLEASEETVKIAQNHLAQSNDIADRVTYIHSTIEELAENHERSFDSIVASEVVEHVADVSMFISSCSKLIKPGGSMFLTTLNKTNLSYFLGIFAAEKLLNLVPDGTHDWNKFIQPQDLQYILNKNGFSTRLLHGMCYNFLTKRWTWIKDTSINYALHAVYSPES